MDNKTRMLIFLWVLGMSTIINASASGFLTTTVSNYADGTKTVGEVWTGLPLATYDSYVRESVVTIPKAYSSAYYEYPVLITASFTDSGLAPIWYGMKDSTTSRYYESHQRTIKVVQDIGGIDYEIPSQVSYKTRCFGLFGTETQCNGIFPRVKSLYLWTYPNMTGSSGVVRVLYHTNPSGLLTYYRFEYDSGTGTYLQHNSTESPDGAYYPQRIFYNGTTRVITSDNNFILDFDGNWVTTSISAGTTTCTPRSASGDIFKAYGGTMVVLDQSSGFDVNASVVLEMVETGAVVMEQGSGSGTIEFNIFPGTTEAVLTSSISDTSPNNLVFEGDVSFTHGIAGTNLYTYFPSYSFINNTFTNWGSSYAYNTSATNFASSMGSGIFYTCGTAYNGITTPFVVKTKSSTMDKVGGLIYTTAPNYNLLTDHYATNGFTSGTKWYTWLMQYNSSKVTGCVFPHSNCMVSSNSPYLTRDSINNIVQAEPFGGRINVMVEFGELCTPEGTDLCVTMSGWSCDVTNDNLGYYDECGNWVTCRIGCLGTCSVDTETYSPGYVYRCGESCYQYPSNGMVYQNCPVGSDTYGSLSYCGIATNTTCDGGCKDGDVCVGPSDKTTYTWSVNGVTPTDVSPLVGATITVTGSTYWNYSIYKSCTTSIGIFSDKGACQMTLPKGSYYIYANATGYTGGCNKLEISPYQTHVESAPYAQCTLNSNPAGGKTLGVGSIDIYQTGVSYNSTTLNVYTFNDVDPAIDNVNVSVKLNSTTTLYGLSDSSGKATFTFTEFTNPVLVTGTKDYFNDTSTETIIVMSTVNYANLVMEPLSTVSINAGGTDSMSRRIVGSSLFNIGDRIDIPAVFTKAGKVEITRERLRIRMCKPGLIDWIPFLNDILGCTEFQDVKVACLMLPQAAYSNIVPVNNTSTDSRKLIPIATIQEAIRNGGLVCNFTSYDANGKPQPKEGLYGLYALRCVTGKGELSPFAGDTVELFFSNYRTIVGLSVNAGESLLKSLWGLPGLEWSSVGEFLSPGAQDIISSEVVMQCNMGVAADLIVSGSNTYDVKVAGQKMNNKHAIDILTSPIYRPYVAHNSPPPVLSVGDVKSKMYSQDDNPLDFALEEYGMNRNAMSDAMYSGEVKVGLNYLPVSRDYLIQDIHHDLVNHLEAGSTYTLDDKQLPNAKFFVEEYLKVTHYPEDGSPASYDYVLVPMYTTNYNTDLGSPAVIILVLAMIVLIGPLYVGYIRARR